MLRTHLAPELARLGFQPAPGTQERGPVRLAPHSIQEAADLLGACTREGWRVQLAGACSRGLHHGGADLVISSQALTGLDVYVPDDLTVGVFAGTTHAALDSELGKHGQMLPLDPPATERGTFGGTFAAAAAGPLRAGYGTPRDLALGIHAVTGDGRIVRVGGQVVKNVAGYDLVRLLIGSRGTLAFLVQVHVRLLSLPAADATLVVTVRDAAEAGELALRLRDALNPVALEVLGARGHEPWRIALRFHGSAAVMDEMERRARALAPRTNRLASPDAAAFWQALRRGEGAAGTRVRLQGRPTELARLLALAGRMADGEHGEWTVLAHGADGIVRVSHPSKQPPGEARLAALLPALCGEAATFDGTCICEAGPDVLREAAPPPAAAAAVARIQGELRRRFDPAGILVGD